MQERSSTLEPANHPHNADSEPHDGVVSFSRQPPPTLLRINADNQDKRAICLFWIIFFVVIIAISIASSFLPRGTFRVQNEPQLKGTNIEGCANPNYFDRDQILQCGNSTENKIGGLMLNLRRQNQFVVLYWKLKLKDNTVQMKDFPIKVNYTHYQLEETQKDGKRAYKIQEKLRGEDNVEVKFQFYKSNSLFAQDEKTLLGFEWPMSVMRNFLEQSHIMIVQMDRNIEDLPNISDIKPQILLVNPQFTKYSLVVRYLFFSFSLIGCVIYLCRLRNIPSGQKIIQQKMIAILSILLIFFNDPFYPITILYPNKASSYFSVFFVINFVIFLIFFWIIFLDRMHYEDGQKETQLIEKKRLIYIAITYVLVLVLYTLIAMDHIDGMPIVQTEQLTSGKYIGLELFALLAILLGFAYIIFSYIRLCMKADSLLWRNQLFLFFSVFFIFMTIALFFVNGFEINSFAGNRILLLFTTMNMYTFYMQYMYSISNEERQRVSRGQIEQGGHGLLQVRSGDGDCVDLEFDDMSVGGGGKMNTQQKLNQFVERNKNQRLMKEGGKEEEMYSPKYGANYQKDLEYPVEQKELIEDDKQTDFFKQNREEEEEQPEIVKKQKQASKGKNQFQQFSLDD